MFSKGASPLDLEALLSFASHLQLERRMWSQRQGCVLFSRLSATHDFNSSCNIIITITIIIVMIITVIIIILTRTIVISIIIVRVITMWNNINNNIRK